MSFVVTLANITQIMEALIPSTSGIGYRSATLTGDPRCAALFSGAQFAVTDPDAKFPESGFVLGTGQAIELIGQSGTENSHPFNTTGDEDFNPTSGSSHDACSISFEFQCSPDFGGDVVVGYSFASDEYREQVDAFTGFADRFGLLLNGDNVALVPGTNEDVSVYSVNHINNTQYFHYNNPRPGQRTYPGFEPDGFTKCLNATGPTNPGWNTMKIGIVDINDLHFDSWVFLQEAGFTCNPDLSITRSPTPAPTNTPTTATPTETPTPAPTILIAETPGAGGDPHFITFDKQFFSYHGQCDLVLTRSQSLGLDVHVRTTRVNNPHMDYSYISGAAMQIRSDIFEVDEKGDLLINGETSTLSAGMVFEGLQSLSKTYRGKNQRIIVYDFDLGNDNKIQIRVNTKSGMLFVDVNGAFEDSEGLLGAAPEQSAASLLARDGETDLSSHWNSYGEEWQVNDSDPKLFQDKTRHPQFPATCEYKADRKNTFMRGSRRHLLETERVSVEAATKACAHLTSVKREFCVDDVMATGDLELVEDPFYGN